MMPGPARGRQPESLSGLTGKLVRLDRGSRSARSHGHDARKLGTADTLRQLRLRQCQFFSDGLLCAAAVAPTNLYLNRASDARVTVTTVTPSRGQALPLARDRRQNQSSASRASVTDRPAVQLVT